MENRMGIQIGAKPNSGFDDPIGMLTDCHRRIEHFLNILCLVVNRTGTRRLTEEEAAAIQTSLQYFRVGGKRHNADEEESLFPRLKEGPGRGSLDELNGLEHDHQVADGLHNTVETLYLKWIANGELAENDRQQLLSETERLKNLYERHIQIEEKTVFPRAAQLLNGATMHAIGEEFRNRRA